MRLPITGIIARLLLRAETNWLQKGFIAGQGGRYRLVGLAGGNDQHGFQGTHERKNLGRKTDDAALALVPHRPGFSTQIQEAVSFSDINY